MNESKKIHIHMYVPENKTHKTLFLFLQLHVSNFPERYLMSSLLKLLKLKIKDHYSVLLIGRDDQ